ncbi:hypothetical protein ON010_g9824 [Phytophthora cinnamomi]|nr:hypothetical protein ON010_g9824 [Phytophthora cinnamomi]
MQQLGLNSGGPPYQRSRYKETASVSLGVSLTQQPDEATPHISSPSTRLQERVLVRRQGKWASSCRVNKAIQSIAILEASGYQLDAQQQRAIMEDAPKQKNRHRYLQALYKRKEKEAMEKNELDIRNLRFAIEVLQKQVQDGIPPPSARKLLGSNFVMRGSVKFYFDNADNRVVRIDTQADMLSPMLQILGSVEKVCQAFDQAFVTPDFRLKGKLVQN